MTNKSPSSTTLEIPIFEAKEKAFAGRYRCFYVLTTIGLR